MSERQVICEIYKVALTGNWKCDRKIRQLCLATLGEQKCADLRMEVRLAKDRDERGERILADGR